MCARSTSTSARTCRARRSACSSAWIELSVYDDEGRAIPSQGGTYWNGEAMQTVDYKDLDETPESVAHANALVAANAAHLATVLREHPYKPSGA